LLTSRNFLQSLGLPFLCSPYFVKRLARRLQEFNVTFDDRLDDRPVQSGCCLSAKVENGGQNDARDAEPVGRANERVDEVLFQFFGSHWYIYSNSH
jgi:hypothetical protein